MNEEETKSQKELQEAVDRMLSAFNTFQEEMQKLSEEQEDLIEHINARVDQQKLAQIRETLKDL